MSKSPHFPCTDRTLEKELPCTLAQLSPTLPQEGGGGVGDEGQWLQMTGDLFLVLT